MQNPLPDFWHLKSHLFILTKDLLGLLYSYYFFYFIFLASTTHMEIPRPGLEPVPEL